MKEASIQRYVALLSPSHAVPAQVAGLVDSFIAEIKKVAATAPTAAELKTTKAAQR